MSGNNNLSPIRFDVVNFMTLLCWLFDDVIDLTWNSLFLYIICLCSKTNTLKSYSKKMECLKKFPLFLFVHYSDASISGFGFTTIPAARWCLRFRLTSPKSSLAFSARARRRPTSSGYWDATLVISPISACGSYSLRGLFFVPYIIAENDNKIWQPFTAYFV